MLLNLLWNLSKEILIYFNATGKHTVRNIYKNEKPFKQCRDNKPTWGSNQKQKMQKSQNLVSFINFALQCTVNDLGNLVEA